MAREIDDFPEQGRAGVAVRKGRRGRVIASGLPNRTGRSYVNASGRIRRKESGRRGRKIFLVTGISIISVMLIAVTALSVFWSYIFSGFVPDKGGEISPHPTEALTYEPPFKEDITNILLIGTDSRDPDNERGRSDSLIILTVDRKHNVIKMSSIMRDSYVYIPGGTRSPDKINAAYSYGGPELALRTVNSTFRLNIEHYISVNMENMAEIIDIAGGVVINVTSGEMQNMNIGLRGDDEIKAPGEQLLNGKQAVQYARVRKVGGDGERTRRQRDVLTLLYKKFMSVKVTTKTQMIQRGLSLIRSNMTALQITALGMDVLPTMSSDIRQMRLPPDGYYKVSTAGSWHMVVDYNKLIPVLYDFIYEEQYPFDPVPTIPYVPGEPSEPTHEPTEGPAEEPSPDPSPEPTTDPLASPSPTVDPLISPEPTADPFASPSPYITPDPFVTTIPTAGPTPTPIPTVTSEALFP